MGEPGCLRISAASPYGPEVSIRFSFVGLHPSIQMEPSSDPRASSVLLRWTPLPEEIGRHPVTVKATDDRGLEIRAKIDLFVLDEPFIRGDGNSDGSVDISDALFILWHLYLNGEAPRRADCEDVDDGGEVNIGDPIYLVEFLFLGGLPPPAPFPAPGNDMTEDDL